MLYFEKDCKISLFRSLTLVFKNMPKIIFIGTHYRKTALLKNWKFCHFWCVLFQKEKELTFLVFSQLNISTNFCCFWKFDIQGSIIVDVKGRRNCYLISMNITYNNRQREAAVLYLLFFRRIVKELLPAAIFQIFHSFPSPQTY